MTEAPRGHYFPLFHFEGNAIKRLEVTICRTSVIFRYSATRGGKALRPLLEGKFWIPA